MASSSAAGTFACRPLYADCISAWTDPPLSSIAALTGSWASLSRLLTSPRSPSLSSRPCSASTTATGSPVISTTTVTRPSAPIAADVNEVETFPADAAGRNRDEGSLPSGVAAYAAAEGRSSASAPAAARMRRRKGGPPFVQGEVPHRGVTRLYGGYAPPACGERRMRGSSSIGAAAAVRRCACPGAASARGCACGPRPTTAAMRRARSAPPVRRTSSAPCRR